MQILFYKEAQLDILCIQGKPMSSYQVPRPVYEILAHSVVQEELGLLPPELGLAVLRLC